MTVPAAGAVAATGATVRAAERLPAMLHVVTDTRALAPGDTFLALRGERFDGHAFVARACALGAAACIVSDAAHLGPDAPALVVRDTLQAYLALAGLARDALRGPVVAISGSAGKTTTKAFLLQLLQAAGIPAAATPENENNEIGVAKFLLGLENGDDRVAVVEMGARKFRDLDPLVAAARPRVAVLTNIGDAHVEIFGSRERLAETKWGLFRGGAHAVLNLADEESRRRAPSLPAAPQWFGLAGDDVPNGVEAVLLADDALVVIRRSGRAAFPASPAVPGAHNRRNLAAAFAAAVALGFDAAQLAPHAGAIRMPAGRYDVRHAAAGARLVFDAYNASMSGTLATLAAFAGERAQRRIAVLGSMAELGTEAPRMHRTVGAAAARAADVVLAGGDFAHDIAQGAYAGGAAPAAVVTYADNAEAVAWLRANVAAGDAILLKGSRKYKMEEIADALQAQAAI